MTIFKMKNSRSAFTMIELTLVIIVSGTILLGMLYLNLNFKENKGHAEERAFNLIISNGINNSFLDILDAFEGSAATYADNSSNWGWWLLPNSSAFPRTVVSGGQRTMVYQFDTNILTAQQLATLHGKIEDNFRGICTNMNRVETRGNIRLLCPRLVSIQYDIGAGATNQPQANGTPINPLLIPNVTITYQRQYHTSNNPDTIETYQFGMNDVYQNRRNYSMRKLNTIRSAMENFHNRVIAREVANTETSGGLNSMDDIFVPWMWKIFGDHSVQIHLNCNKFGGTTCTNLNTNNIWRSALSNKGLFTRRVITNLLAGDNSFSVDGFNNPIFIFPFMSNCPTAENDISACTVTIPTLPADNYIATGNPPFVSAIYIPSFSNKTIAAPDYGRMYVSY